MGNFKLRMLEALLGIGLAVGMVAYIIIAKPDVSSLFTKDNIIEIVNEIEVERESSGIFVILGDNISAKDRKMQENKKSHYIGYQQHIKEELGMNSYINLAINDSTVAKSQHHISISEVIGNFDFGNADFLIIQAGTNDFALGVPIGDRSEIEKTLNNNSFYSGYSNLIRDIRKNNQDIDIYLITPTKRDCKGFEDICININSTHITQYVNAVKEIGEYFNVHVIDVYGLPHMTEDNIYDYTIDGVHLNDRGFKLIANKFIYDFNKINKKRGSQN